MAVQGKLCQLFCREGGSNPETAVSKGACCKMNRGQDEKPGTPVQAAIKGKISHLWVDIALILVVDCDSQPVLGGIFRRTEKLFCQIHKEGGKSAFVGADFFPV